MSLITSSPNQASGQSGVLVVQTPTMLNTIIAMADTEQSITIPASRKLRINSRGSSTIRLGFYLGATTTAYRIIPLGGFYESPNLDGSGITLYIQSPQAGETVEIESWV